MKKLSLLFGITMLLACLDFTCVAHPTTNSHDKYSVSMDVQISDINIIVFENYKAVEGFGSVLFAIVPEAVIMPTNSITFLKTCKSVYKDPDIDRKWVWWNSVITNS